MSEALEKLRARNRIEVTLPSGLKVTLRLPKLIDYLSIMGSLPTPLLEKAEAASEDGDQEAAGRELIEQAAWDERLTIARTLDALVNITVVAVEGEPVTAEDKVADDLDQEDCLVVVQYAQRRLTDPKASGSINSEPSSNGPEPISTPPPANDMVQIRPGSWETTSLP